MEFKYWMTLVEGKNERGYEETCSRRSKKDG